MNANFERLLVQKKKFTIRWLSFAIFFYFSLPLLVSFAPELMKQRVAGDISFAWLLALAQFAMTGLLTVLYIRKAKSFDALVEKTKKGGELT